jgi:predicted Ser/Thr protein kinase
MRIKDVIKPTVETLEQFREVTMSRVAENLRNIYLENIKAYSVKSKVNVGGVEIEPDERFMRLVEKAMDNPIPETGIEGWRKTIWNAWLDNRNTQMLDVRLGPVFLKMADTYQVINRCLILYPNNLML